MTCGIDPKALAKSSQAMHREDRFLLASSMAVCMSVVCSAMPCTPGRNPFWAGESHPQSVATAVSLEDSTPENVL